MECSRLVGKYLVDILDEECLGLQIVDPVNSPRVISMDHAPNQVG